MTKIMFTILLLWLHPTGSAGAADTLSTKALWRELQQANAYIQRGMNDSALIRGQELLPRVEANGNVLLLAMNHVLLGASLGNLDQKQQAHEEFLQVAALSEQHHFADLASRPKNSFLYQTMVMVYAQLALFSEEQGQKVAAVEYSKKGMEWAGRSPETDNNYIAITVFTEILLKHGQTMIITDDITVATNDEALATVQPDSLPPTVSLVDTLPSAALPADTLPLAVDTLPLAVDKQPMTDSLRVKDAAVDSTVASSRPTVTVAVLVAGLLLIFATFLLWQRRMRKKRRLLSAQEMEASYREGQENERARLARELHDNVSNQLLAVEMKLHSDGLTQQTMQLLNESREQVRRVSHQLMPPEFEHTTLCQAMAGYAAGQDGLNHCRVEFVPSPPNADWTLVPAKTALEVYRIMQEAVANAQKHAQATLVSIGLQLHNGRQLVLTVSDDGSAKTDANNNSTVDSQTVSQGIGRQTMRQRATAIGGTLDFHRHRFGNTVCLKVILP